MVAMLRICTWAARARSAADGAKATGVATRGRTARATIGGAPHSLTRLRRRSAGRCAGRSLGGCSAAGPGAGPAVGDGEAEPPAGPFAAENAGPPADPCTGAGSAAACMPSNRGARIRELSLGASGPTRIAGDGPPGPPTPQFRGAHHHVCLPPRLLPAARFGSPPRVRCLARAPGMRVRFAVDFPPDSKFGRESRIQEPYCHLFFS